MQWGRRLLGVVILVGLVLPDAYAQFGRGGADIGEAPSLALSYHAVDFAYVGAADADLRFDFRAPVLGLTYTRPGLHVAAAYGRQDAGETAAAAALRYVDLSLVTWGAWRPLEATRTERFDWFVPVALHSNYRLVAERESEQDNTFSVTMLGLGTGAGAYVTIQPAARLHLRTTPGVGFATRSLDGAPGVAWLFDTDAELRLGPVVGRWGLTLGYRYRWQRWNLTSSGLLREVGSDLFDYREHRHVLRVGLVW